MTCRCLIAALLVTACADAEPQGSKQRPPVAVEVATVATRDFAEELIALGTLNAHKSVDVTANVTEKVSRVAFRDGQTVRAGQVLVELVRAEEMSRLDLARALLSREETELRRVETLAADNIATASELDTQRTKVATTRASLNTVQAMLGDRLVLAPFAGVVGLRQVSPGSLVTPTTIITTLDAIDLLNADLLLPERFLGQIAPGQVVHLESDAFTGEDFVGEVIAIAGRVDPTTRAITVRARIANPDGRLRPGMLMRALLSVGTRKSPAVPEHALLQRASRAFVYTVNDESIAELVEVQIGRRQPGWVEIRSGLDGGERVVVAGTNRVQPGTKVIVGE